MVAGVAICLGWLLGIRWLCGDPNGDSSFVWFDSIAGLALAGVFEAVALESVAAALALWVGWAVFSGTMFAPGADNPVGFFLTFAGLPALGVGLGLIFGKRRARTAR